MKLIDLVASVDPLRFDGNKNQEITGVAFHSQQVKPGYLFVSIVGLKTDGHLYIDDAIRRGAKAVVVEEWQELPAHVAQIEARNTRQALAKISSLFFGEPTTKLKLIGVTGTNGKTTTSKLIESIFSASGAMTGLLGTIEYKIGDERLPVGRTTPESYDLQNIFCQMVEKKVDVAVMEVSSHAVDMHRSDECQFDALVFTNLSQDHLDYHGTLDKYFEVKNKLFVDHAWRECIFVVNVDDKYGQRILRIPNVKKVEFGLAHTAKVRASDIILKSKGSHFGLDSPVGSREIVLRLLGMFNVYNALAAASVGIAFGLPLEVIKTGLEAVQNVPGRFEVIDCGQDFSVVVDYAHTPDGLEKLLTSARNITKGKLITVFGCGGDRDKLKRPLMGEIAGSLSDYSIATSDNPRSEDPKQIISEIEEGLKKAASDYCTIVDRKDAINKGIALAKKNDCVIIAGKGHETYQEFKDQAVPFNDCAVARAALEELAKCSP